MRGAVQDQARSVVRVLLPAGDPVGAGFLIGPDLVATCAHVVAEALTDADPYAAQAPPGSVRVDLPLVRGAATDSAPLTARVLRWSPISEDGGGDIAVLQLERPAPEGARMPPLRRVDELWDHEFRVLGFPDGLADGVWATGRIRGEQGTRWFQLQGAPGDQAIEPGFSGSPVWDEETGAVVGMTVAADRSAATTTAYLIPIDQVIGLDPELLPCPYRGLEPFGEEHAAFFFGRDPDLARLVDAVGGQPLVAVAGPSGVGKSSLVRAGLLARRRDEGVRIAELRASIGTAPASALAAALVPVMQPDLSPDERTTAIAEAATQLGSLDAAVRAATARALAARAPDAGVLLFVDQFEELAATEPAAARELLLLLVDLVHDGRIRAVLTVRWESLTELMTAEQSERLGDALDSVLDAGSALVAGTVLVGPLDRTRLRDAVVGPAERAPGLSFEPGLVERILDDAGAEPGQLPLVESLLTELWERRAGGYLTLAAYEAAGGVAGAVAKRAEELLAEFPDPAERDRLRRLFTLLAQPDREGRFVRRPVPLAELAQELRDLVPRLVAGRLLVVQPRAGGTEMLELAHQALIEHWPRLRGWLTEDRDFLAWRAQLDQQRDRWVEADQDPGALLRGTALAAAQQWLPERAAELSPAAHDYLGRSQARQRREVRRWRMVTAVLAVLVVAAGVLTVVVYDRGNQLADRLRVANADSLVREAQQRGRSDPELATRLALAAFRADPASAAARSVLAERYLAMRSVRAIHPDVTGEPLDGMAFIPQADAVILPGPRAGFVRVGGVGSGRLDRWTVPDVEPGSVVRGRSDGSSLLIVGDDGVRRWDVAARTSVDLGVDVTAADLTTVADDDDASRLAWLTPPGPAGQELVVWDIAARAPVPHAIGPITEPFAQVYLNDDPSVVVLRYGSDTGQQPVRTVVRSLADGRELRVLPDDSLPIVDGFITCVPAPDPQALGTAGNRAMAVVMNDLGAEVRRIPLVDQDCTGLEVSLEQDYLIERRFQSDDTGARLVRLTRLADGAAFDANLPRETLTEARQARVRLAPTTGVMTAGDGNVEVLRASGRSLLRIATTPALTLPGRPSATRLSLTADGRFAVGVVEDGYVTFDARTGREVGRIFGRDLPHPGRTTSSVDGNELSLVVGLSTGWVVDRLSIPDFTLVASYPLPGSGPAAAAKTGDGRLVAVSGSQLTAWDTTTHDLVGGPFPVDLPASNNVEVAVRPGHPGEVALLTIDRTIALWDAETGTRTAMPREGAERVMTYTMTFDRTGDRLAYFTHLNTIEVWDMREGRPAQPPIAVSTVYMAAGFDAQGHLLSQSATETGANRVTFWDLDAGREFGSVVLPAHDAGPISADGTRMALNGFGGAPPIELPLSPEQWRDELCTFADRPFTEHELDALPPGFDTASPCS